MKKMIAALTAVATIRCGTIVHGSSQNLPVTSDPPGAAVRVSCADGTAAEATTPATIPLRRNAENCALTVSKSGFETETVALRRAKSNAIVGNVGASVLTMAAGIVVGVLAGIALGGGNLYGSDSTINAAAIAGGIAGLVLPGWLDARSGAMYRQEPARVDVTLRPSVK